MNRFTFLSATVRNWLLSFNLTLLIEWRLVVINLQISIEKIMEVIVRRHVSVCNIFSEDHMVRVRGKGDLKTGKEGG